MGSEVKEAVDRTGLLLGAEEATLAGGGIVIRFGGLYTKNQGPHNFWLKSGREEFPSLPNGFINLIHYDDAALAVVAALTAPKAPGEGKLFLASDGVPISRRDICLVSLKCPDYKDCKVPNFTGDAGKVDGKKYDSARIRQELQWQPKFETYENFMSELSDAEVQSAL